MLGRPDFEHNRIRLGVLFLIIGGILIIWAWGSWVFRATVPAHSIPMIREPGTGLGLNTIPENALLGFAIAPTALVLAWSDRIRENSGPKRHARSALLAQAEPEHADEKKLQLLSLTTLTLILLLIVFFFGSYAIVIGARRWRAMALRKRAAPTPNEDVWAMHKTPEDELEEP